MSNSTNKYQVQLAKPIDKNFKGFSNPKYSRKFDGKRMYILDGVGYSRTNRECYQDPIKHIIEEVKSMSFCNEYVFDGELLYFEDDGIENFKKGISLANSKNYTPECSKLIYVIFDMIPREYFINQEAKEVFLRELERMYYIFDPMPVLTPDLSTQRPDLVATRHEHIFLAAQYTSDKLLREYKDFDKWEGLMVRDGDAPYQFKRTGNLRKIKQFKDIELPIIDFQEGTGKYEGTLGAILVKYKGGIVSVGSGFTDKQRDRVWNNRDECLKYNVKVKFFEESKNEKGEPSLRFPTFLAFRDIETMEEFT